MFKALLCLVAFTLLAIAEVVGYHVLREAGVPSIAAIGLTLTFCFGCFCLFVALFLLRESGDTRGRVATQSQFRQESPRRYDTDNSRQSQGSSRSIDRDQLYLPEKTSPSSGQNYPRTSDNPSSGQHHRVSDASGQHYQRVSDNGSSGEHRGLLSKNPTMLYVAPEAAAEVDFEQPSSSLSALHSHSESYINELRSALEAQRKQFSDLVVISSKELSRFDVNVLKSLERNQPGSIEGVVVARKILFAIEQRVKDIDKLLAKEILTDQERAQQLLTADLEIPEDKLTSMFKTQAIPPIRLSEVEFHLKVLLKRISRRRSIFRGPLVDLADGA